MNRDLIRSSMTAMVVLGLLMMPGVTRADAGESVGELEASFTEQVKSLEEAFSEMVRDLEKQFAGIIAEIEALEEEKEGLVAEAREVVERLGALEDGINELRGVDQGESHSHADADEGEVAHEVERTSP